MAEATSQPETAIPAPVVAGKDTRKQIILTDVLRQHIGDILAVDLAHSGPGRTMRVVLSKVTGSTYSSKSMWGVSV